MYNAQYKDKVVPILRYSKTEVHVVVYKSLSLDTVELRFTL
jgi:hypothetical protein